MSWEAHNTPDNKQYLYDVGETVETRPRFKRKLPSMVINRVVLKNDRVKREVARLDPQLNLKFTIKNRRVRYEQVLPTT